MVPIIKYHPSPELAVRPLYENLDVRSILDVGAGRGGVFDMGYWQGRIMERCHACDLYWMKELPANWNVRVGVNVEELTKFYPRKSFDMVQCMEVLEHVARPLASIVQLCEVARKFVLISTTDEESHKGEEQKEIEKINPGQKYIGRPSPEELMQLGFTVRLAEQNPGQLVAWQYL